jgi:predicted nucleic acid-binding protein
MRKVISNTTPLIGLADIGCFDVLQKIYGEIMIPDAVLEEVKSEPARTLVRHSEFIHVFSVADSQARKMFSSRLHAGEVEVMLLAEEKQADLLIMDDNAAKKTAKFLGFKVTGTLGVLLKAKQEGYVKNIKQLVEKLQDTGFYVSPKVKQYVLEEAHEM